MLRDFDVQKLLPVPFEGGVAKTMDGARTNQTKTFVRKAMAVCTATMKK